jgi:lysophospholipase L1-like esterase
MSLERLVRYCHPAKLLDGKGLGAIDDAALYDAPAATCRALADTLRREARAIADDLAGTPLPFAPGARLLAIGDSHTDDLGSWAQVLAHLHDGVVVNAGVSGDTTTHVLARVDRLPRADHAIVLLATNDARRHGGPMLVSHAETRRNVCALDRALRRFCAAVTWITPPPVDERRLAADAAVAAAGVSWRLPDVVGKADIVRATMPGTVDLWPGFRAAHLAADGLHPSPQGQRFIIERLLAGPLRDRIAARP